MFGLGIGAQVGSPAAMARSRANRAVAAQESSDGSSNDDRSDKDNKKCFVQKYLTNCRSYYSCIYCRTHLANHDDLVSRSFQGNRGRASLFNSVINISCGPSVQRTLNTGAHSVADIFCTNCGTTMGWKYEKAFVESQKYKEGKYIIELAHVVRENRHLELDKRDMLLNSTYTNYNNSYNVNSFHHRNQHSTKTSSPSSTNRCLRDSSTTTTIQTPSTLTQQRRQQQHSLLDDSTGGSRHHHRWSSSASSSSGYGGGGGADDEVLIDDREVVVRNADKGRQRDIRAAADYYYDDDDDDELMFPICDDLIHMDRLSCPNSSMSSSLLNGSYIIGGGGVGNRSSRLRRSLYLDSAPYDWKYSNSYSSSSSSPPPTPSTSAGTGAGVSENTATSSTTTATAKKVSNLSAPVVSSLCASSTGSTQSRSMSPSSLSPPSSSPPHSDASTSASSSSSASPSSSAQSGNNKSPEPTKFTSSLQADEEDCSDETQFKFEVEVDTKTVASNQDEANEKQQHNSCDNTKPKQQALEAASTSGELLSLVVPKIGAKRENNNKAMATTTRNNADASDNDSRTNSLSLDDEEFYDCCTDHDVSNSMVQSQQLSSSNR